MPQSETASACRIVPVVHNGIILAGENTALDQMDITIDGQPAEKESLIRQDSYIVMTQPPSGDYTLDIRSPDTDKSLPGLPLRIQSGLWRGAVQIIRDTLVYGYAENTESPVESVALVAYSGGKIIAFATTRPADAGSFCLVLPRDIVDQPKPPMIHIGVVGSDYVLRNGSFTTEKPHKVFTPNLLKLPLEERSIRIKISTPNMKEAPMWGDYHFAVSLKQALERLGQRTSIDTLDSWYNFAGTQDATITLRGRQPYEADPHITNIMWLISHPDRIEAEEYQNLSLIHI